MLREYVKYAVLAVFCIGSTSSLMAPWAIAAPKAGIVGKTETAGGQ